jgi:hypothetical protein
VIANVFDGCTLQVCAGRLSTMHVIRVQVD